MLQAIEVFRKNRLERGEAIYREARLGNRDDDIEKARKLSRVINSFAFTYFDLLYDADQSRINGSVLLPSNLPGQIREEIERFKPLAKSELERTALNIEQLARNPNNIYQLAGAVKLSAANAATRNLSTTMGLLWERIANISPYALNPEAEFNVKIKGVDLVSRNTAQNSITYCQLKTQRNTLTGSQKSRSVAELGIHDHPLFCACFALGSWTFNNPNIPRIAGEHFWSEIGIDYGVLEHEVIELMLYLERIFSSL